MKESWNWANNGEYSTPYSRHQSPYLPHYAKNYSREKSAQKIYWKRTAKKFRQDLRNFTENTTLHGFRYLSLDEVTLAGKFIWLIVCLVSFSLSIYLMFTAWYKYQITPTVTSIESTTHPIWGLRFPAVTICNYNKVYAPRAKAMAHRMKKAGLNDSEIKDFFDALPKLISEEYLMRDFEDIQDMLDDMGIGSAEPLMYRLMQPCDKLILRCSWLSVKHDCKRVFKTVRTSQGFCCAFNYHVIGGEYPPGGFAAKDKNKWNISTQPGVHKVQMVPGAGRDAGLTIFIDVEAHNYRASIRPYVGAAILIHDPFIYPEINIQNVIVQPAQDVSVIAKEYSYQSCITECKMEHILAYCRCLPFYYPNTIEYAKRCDLVDVPCLRAYSGFLNKMRTPFNNMIVNGTKPRSVVPKCLQCLPACSANGYTVETETAVLTNDHNDDDKSSNLTKSRFSIVTVFFPDITCLKYRRETFMTWDNLLATFGGIFGLCIGGSIVSFVEIIYYMIIWLFGRKRAADKSVKSVPSRIVDTSEKLVSQSVAPMKNVSTRNRTNAEHYTRGPDYNFDNNKIAPRSIDFPQRPLGRATFTIELSNTRAKFPPNFVTT